MASKGPETGSKQGSVDEGEDLGGSLGFLKEFCSGMEWNVPEEDQWMWKEVGLIWPKTFPSWPCVACWHPALTLLSVG